MEEPSEFRVREKLLFFLYEKYDSDPKLLESLYQVRLIQSLNLPFLDHKYLPGIPTRQGAFGDFRSRTTSDQIIVNEVGGNSLTQPS